MGEQVDDAFRYSLEMGRGVGLEKTEQLREAMKTALPCSDEGNIFWAARTMAKKWYWPRRGRRGLVSLLQDLPVERKRTVYLLRSDQQEAVTASVDDIFKNISDYHKQGTALLILPDSGRWIVEISVDDYLYFDFSIPDEKEFQGLFGACPL